ncbi:helix-turn-helix domain-containing protein [Caballeronia sp. dw_19]|uniref:helix-turn-helix domain-containing protein n=1 Tax=Caballeronia sp. dw_19 TaxID=2719791 RepID=UPI001BCD3E59|nr:helix-turn-helix domain-containing protein [Caballeronia sp. dw_19]
MPAASKLDRQSPHVRHSSRSLALCFHLGCRDDLASPIWASLSIERIAYRNGFDHPAHFSRRFRAASGMSPRDFLRVR